MDVTQDTQSAGWTPPRRLSVERSSPWWHPCVNRIGVRVDGVELTDCWMYDLERMEYRRGQYGRVTRAESIEPYVRITAESRQERRARERWEQKHQR